MWETVEIGNETHIIPVEDMRQHDGNSKCWCNPLIEFELYGTIVTHNSLDERELYETGQRKPH